MKHANFLFLFHQKNSESPEIIFLWHFQKAKKVAIKTLMAIKTLAIKTLMYCTSFGQLNILALNIIGVGS